MKSEGLLIKTSSHIAMSYLFSLIDKTGRVISLTTERWSHITAPQSQHAYMAGYLEEIKIALEKPSLIIQNKFDDTKWNYYLYLKDQRNYLLVSVKYLNGEGYIMTSFITRKIIRR